MVRIGIESLQQKVVLIKYMKLEVLEDGWKYLVKTEGNNCAQHITIFCHKEVK